MTGDVMKFINLALKRIFDIVASGFLIILLIPLFGAVALCVKTDSDGPVIFRQGRRTKNGRIFDMLKFRTMVVDAEDMGTGLFSYANDPRVTKFGRKLRESSLDELPQLFNIFKGDMSFVGPRPCVTYELGDFETLNSKYKKRFSVKAGLTGLAQIKGRNDISWDEKVDLDNEYVDMFDRYGVLIDIGIFFKTVFKTLKHEKIYESKADVSMNDVEASQNEEAEIIRKAHIPD